MWAPLDAASLLKVDSFPILQPIHTLEWQMREGLVALCAKTPLESYQAYRALSRNTQEHTVRVRPKVFIFPKVGESTLPSAQPCS